MSTAEVEATANNNISSVLHPSLKVGALCGTAGFLFGGTSGVLKGTTPVLFASASAIQSFALGSTFWACRSAFLQTQYGARRTSSDKTKASAFAGCVSGGLVGLLTRGRANVLPGMLVMSLIGGAGQIVVNRLSGRTERDNGPTEGVWTRMAKQKWSPIEVLSDEQYAARLRERLLKIDVEIAVVDDRIAEVKKLQALDGASKDSNESTSMPER